MPRAEPCQIDAVDGLQLLQYSQQGATFTGIEGQVRQRITRHMGVTLFGDTVRARLRHAEPGVELQRPFQ